MDWTSPPIIAAVISVVGLVVLAPLAKRRFFDPVHRLRADISVFKAKYTSVVSAIIKKTLNELISEDREKWEMLFQIDEIESYSILRIRNVGKKKSQALL
jgi:hypothetical protein